jgi:hypothetical protein
LKKGKRHSASSHSKAEAAHLDNLLDEALRETFPASDPIAITIDKPTRRVTPPDNLHGSDSPSMRPGTREVVASRAPPVVGFFDANLWALRQISDYFDWWCRLLGGRK